MSYGGRSSSYSGYYGGGGYGGRQGGGYESGYGGRAIYGAGGYDGGGYDVVGYDGGGYDYSYSYGGGYGSNSGGYGYDYNYRGSGGYLGGGGSLGRGRGGSGRGNRGSQSRGGYGRGSGGDQGQHSAKGGSGRGGGGGRGRKKSGGAKKKIEKVVVAPPVNIAKIPVVTHNWDEYERHGLMQSMFMVEKPDKFETDWLFFVCPPGRRRVLVASWDETEAYNSAGAADFKFNSCLPAGNKVMYKNDDSHKDSDITILDAVYSAEKRKFYLVDLCHWKHYPYYETEADFRFFQLASKYADLKNPTEQKIDVNEFPLEYIPKYVPTKEKIEEVLKAWSGKVEGLIFVRKNSTYQTSYTDDSLWLKLDKMKDILDIQVPEGVEYAATNNKDEKAKRDQETRKKSREETLAAIEQNNLLRSNTDTSVHSLASALSNMTVR